LKEVGREGHWEKRGVYNEGFTVTLKVSYLLRV
jgi:hypothetical protein